MKYIHVESINIQLSLVTSGNNQTLTPAFHNLKKITDALLFPEMNYNAVREAAFSLKKLFRETVVFDHTEFISKQHIRTHTGLAVSPWTAAFCIIDMMLSYQIQSAELLTIPVLQI